MTLSSKKTLLILMGAFRRLLRIEFLEFRWTERDGPFPMPALHQSRSERDTGPAQAGSSGESELDYFWRSALAQ